MAIPGIGVSDYGFIGPTIPGGFKLLPHIDVTPSLSYTGQTITIHGTGFNATPYPGDPEPIVFCNAYSYDNGTMRPIKVQSDGSFVIQPTPNAAGEADIYAKDRWGTQSNKVHLKVTNPVTISVSVVDGKNAPYVTSGVFCLKYPASSGSHFENSIMGSTYTTRMAFNGTSAEVWVRQNPLTTEHETIQNIQEGKTYTVTLTMPVNTPVPTATPTQSAQPTVTPTNMPSTLPGAPDTVAPVTTLNLTGVKDASGVFTSNVVCTLTALDNSGGSGVSETSYSFDGNNWTTYTGPFTITTPGNTTVFYRSDDKAGNQEVAGLQVIAILGTATAMPSAQPGMSCCAALLLPLLAAGFVVLYGSRKR